MVLLSLSVDDDFLSPFKNALDVMYFEFFFKPVTKNSTVCSSE